MNSHIMKRTLPVMAVLLLTLALGVVGCKKKMPKEAPPPPPKVEEVQPVAPVDTTGTAERERKAAMDSDQQKIMPVYFEYDKSEIRGDQRDRISGNADIFRRWSDWKINIEGHCDERGTAEYNLALGERRATAGKQALTAAGIDPARIFTVSYGKERPADPGHSEAAWSKNRRDEFRVK